MSDNDFENAMSLEYQVIEKVEGLLGRELGDSMEDKLIRRMIERMDIEQMEDALVSLDEWKPEEDKISE